MAEGEVGRHNDGPWGGTAGNGEAGEGEREEGRGGRQHEREERNGDDVNIAAVAVITATLNAAIN